MTGMVEQTATVVRVEQGVAWVSTRSSSACGHCEARAGCGTAVMAGMRSEREHLLQVRDRLDVRAGDRIVIGVSDTVVLKASALAYLLPLGGLMTAAGLGQLGSLGDGPSILLGISGLGIGLWFTRRITGGEAGGPSYSPVMLRQAQTPPASTITAFKRGVQR